MNVATEKFIAELKQRDDVEGIILFGSWARGNNRTGSDVDLVVLLSAGYKRSVEYCDGQAFEIIYVTPDSALEYWNVHRDDAASLWEVARVVFDRHGAAAELEQKARAMLAEGKPKLDEMAVKRFAFDMDNFFEYVETIADERSAEAQFLLEGKVRALTELFFDLRQAWIPSPKQRWERIKAVDPEFYSLLVQFYKESTVLSERLRLASIMTKAVFKTN